MKGLSTTILIVVSAVVILVAALVVLAIFSGGMKSVTDFSQAKALCMQQAAASCSITGNIPNTWNSQTMVVNNAATSCFSAAGDCKCIEGKLSNC